MPGRAVPSSSSVAQGAAQGAAQRVVAFAAAVVLLACGVLGLHHEADGAHVRDPRSGALLHGHALAGTHVDSAQSDVHGRADDHDADGAACALDAAIHQAALAALAAAPAALSLAPAPALALPTAPRIAASAKILHHAPKTSPPIRG